MRLLLLSLAVVLMGGEAVEDLRNPPSARIYYVMPSPQHFQQIRTAHQAMRFRAQTSPLLGMSDRRPTRLVPKRGTIFVSFQGPTTDNEHSGLHQTRKQSDKPSTVNQAGIRATRNPSLFNQDPKPSVFKQQRRPPGFSFVQGFKTPSFESDNNPSRSEEEKDSSLFSQDLKPASSEDERKKPSSSDADRKYSGFGQHANKPFDKENKTSLVEMHPSRPDRNPECYMRPDPGTCRAAFPRYYFDQKTGTCNCFLYGGCRDEGEGEGLGSYFTLEACQKECRPPKKEEGPICKEIFKEDQFISFLKPSLHNTQPPDHLSDDDFLASLL